MSVFLLMPRSISIPLPLFIIIHFFVHRIIRTRWFYSTATPFVRGPDVRALLSSRLASLVFIDSKIRMAPLFHHCVQRAPFLVFWVVLQTCEVQHHQCTHPYPCLTRPLRPFVQLFLFFSCQGQASSLVDRPRRGDEQEGLAPPPGATRVRARERRPAAATIPTEAASLVAVSLSRRRSPHGR